MSTSGGVFPGQTTATPNDGQVTPTLNAASSGAVLFDPVLNYWHNGASWDKARTPAVFKTVTASASGDNAIWTPAAGKKFRLMGYVLTVTNNVAQAVAGGFDLRFRDAATDMAHAATLFVPAAAGTVTGAALQLSANLGNGILSAVANNVLNLNLPAATTAGIIRVSVYGTEE